MRLFWLALGSFGLWQLYRRVGRRGEAAIGDPGTPQLNRKTVPHVTYEVVEHDGGWAYKLGDVFSETFASREEAVRAAEQAAAAHESAGTDAHIEYQDGQGRWHEEMESGEDRPEVDVEQRPSSGNTA